MVQQSATKTLKPTIKTAFRAVILGVVLVSLSACGVFSGNKEKDNPKDWSAARLYREARDEMTAGNWAAAIKQLETLESRYPFGVYAQQAQIDVAYAHYKDGDKEQTLAACDRFIRMHPNHPAVDYVYFLKGLVNFNDTTSFLGQLFEQDPSERDSKAARDAFDAFKELATKFPDSKYTPDAVARMRYLVNALANHEVHVARYYYERGAYLAAVNRSQTALRDFPQAPVLEEALFIMMLSYDKLGLKDARADTERVFKQNFPNSTLASTGLRAKNKPWWTIF